MTLPLGRKAEQQKKQRQSCFVRAAKPAEVCRELFGAISFGIQFEIGNLTWEKSGGTWGEVLSTCQEGKFRGC